MMLHLTRSDSKILIFNNSRNTLAILMSKDTANTMNKYFTLIEKHQMNAVDKITYNGYFLRLEIFAV